MAMMKRIPPAYKANLSTRSRFLAASFLLVLIGTGGTPFSSASFPPILGEAPVMVLRRVPCIEKERKQEQLDVFKKRLKRLKRVTFVV